jgi:hypothetical protein
MLWKYKNICICIVYINMMHLLFCNIFHKNFTVKRASLENFLDEWPYVKFLESVWVTTKHIKKTRFDLWIQLAILKSSLGITNSIKIDLS